MPFSNKQLGRQKLSDKKLNNKNKTTKIQLIKRYYYV